MKSFRKLVGSNFRSWQAGLAVIALMLALVLDGAEAPAVQAAPNMVVSRDLTQCSNKQTDNQLTTIGTCKWINSTLNATRSNYLEGMSVPQRSLFTNIDATSGNIHVLTFEHAATTF